jgi:RecA-family ATPase
VLRHYGAKFADVAKDLHLVSLAGKDAVLGYYHRKSARIQPTPLYAHVLEMAGDLRPTMIGIASSADVFAGNEIDRSQVQQFVALLTRMAMLAQSAVVLISHPSLTGINTDSGLSGSTQWNNSVRARFYLKSMKGTSDDAPETNLREIVFKKNNYGPISASVGLEYRSGLFLPVETELDVAVKGERAKNVFLTLLARFNAQNRNVSANNGPGYAPKVFAEEPEAREVRLTKTDLAGAMRLLLKSGEIVQESYGKASNPHYRLVIPSEDM